MGTRDDDELATTRGNARRRSTTSATDADPDLLLESSIQNTFVHVAIRDHHEESSRRRARSVPRSARLALPQDGSMSERGARTMALSSNVLEAFSAVTSEPHQKQDLVKLGAENELSAKDKEIETLRCLLRQAE